MQMSATAYTYSSVLRFPAVLFRTLPPSTTTAKTIMVVDFRTLRGKSNGAGSGVDMIDPYTGGEVGVGYL